MSGQQELREWLESLAEPDFQKFSSTLIPNLSAGRMLGVRLPKLRRVAKKIARADWRDYLAGASDQSFEEVLLQGMVIGCAAMPLEEALERIRGFLPKIENWSVCDSFCAGLKIAREYPEAVWNLALGCLDSSAAYTVRFGIVMLIDYYCDQEHLALALARLEQIQNGDYYVQMAVAWAVSAYYAAAPTQTEAFLDQCRLDDFTYHKALQKICESKKTGPDAKKRIRAKKRQREFS